MEGIETKMNVRVFGERLRDARIIQGLPSKAVAEQSGIAPSQLTRLEHAHYTEVNVDTAERLSQTLSFPLGFLTHEPNAAIKPGSTLFRARRTMTRREEEKLHTWSRLIGQVLMAIADKVEIPRLALPNPQEFHDAKSAAEVTRRSFGIDAFIAIPHVMRTIERGGVPIANLHFETEIAKHDAFSCWVSSAGGFFCHELPTLVVRVLDSWEKTRYSAAHELGHLVMHRNGVADEVQAEAEANDFARHFLLPGEILQSLWPEIPTLNNIMHIKVEYGVSLSALVEHAWRSKLIDDRKRTSFYKQMSNRRDPASGLRWRDREPGANDREVERPRLLARMVETVFGDGLRLNELSSATGNWPLLHIRRALAGQVWSVKEGQKVGKRPSDSAVIPMMRRSQPR